MDDRYLQTLEFPKIIAQLASHASFSASQILATELRPATELDEVRQRQLLTSEAKALLSIRPETRLGAAHDVRTVVDRAALGATLQIRELLDVHATLGSARRMRYVLQKQTETCPNLAAKGKMIEPLSDVSEAIMRCLDEDGHVLDSASTTLANIRRESAIARDRLLDRLHRIVSGPESRYLQEALVTERNRRYVIPLRTEFKGRIPGIIHDQSASGATLFIEPLATVDLNNRWHELQLQERDEIDRILAALSHAVGMAADWITRNVELLAEIDLALAKAKYSFALRARAADVAEINGPIASDDSDEAWAHPLHLKQARHPLLPADEVVPIDIYIGTGYSVLLITGPNTGGKTVSLKTVGLLAAMHQAGLHIPVNDGSSLPIFRGIYADIGDEQSIEQSLSTFSSHMTHIIDILAHADKDSLVLLDELGAGTDPVEGAALAQSIIHRLREIGCLTVSSTHYSQLKVFAFETPGIQNASVEFDVETLSPTYKLVIGLPGRSNAFAIAEKLGLDPTIIKGASSLVSPADHKADMMLASVKEASDAAVLAQSEAEQRLAKVNEMEQELRGKLGAIEEARRRVLEEAREQGREELDALRKRLRNIEFPTQREARTSESKAKQVVEETLDELESGLRPVRTRVAPPPDPNATKVRPGDTVHVAMLDQTGELLSIAGNTAEVRVGGFRLKTDVDSLTFKARPTAKSSAAHQRINMPKAASPGMELDLRGYRAEAVEPELQRYINDAYMAGLPWIHIIHGKGTGVVKKMVRTALKRHTLVDSYRPGELAEGGDGVTVAKLHAIER